MIKKFITWLSSKRITQPPKPPSATSETVVDKLPEEIHFHWHFNDMSALPKQFTWNAQSNWNSELTAPIGLTEVDELTHDAYLYEHALTQWQFGDWESLIEIKRETLETHPERAKLALLNAAGHQQLGNMQETREFVSLAKDWGCDKKLISRVLVAGVYNTLGKAALIQNDRQASEKYFRVAVDNTGRTKTLDILSKARLESQVKQLHQTTVSGAIGSLSAIKEPIHKNNSGLSPVIPQEAIDNQAIENEALQYLFENKTLEELHKQAQQEHDVEVSLSKVLIAWQMNDFDSLTHFKLKDIYQHPQRERLALLLASSHQKLDQYDQAREFARLAVKWGCPKAIMLQIMREHVQSTIEYADTVINGLLKQQ